MPSATRNLEHERETYRPDIDGLRAVAIIIVVGYHAGIPGFAGGYVGVDVFFVISGYLIVGLLARELRSSGQINWRAFYARRVRRLIPAQTVLLLVVLLVGAAVLFPLGDQQSLAKAAIAASAFSANLYYWKFSPTSYFDVGVGGDVLLHMWSLAVEEQFYLALPLAVLAAAVTARATRLRLQHSLVLWCGIGSAASLAVAVMAADHVGASFYLPITRAYEFGAGAILALLGADSARRMRGRLLVSVLGGSALASCLIWPLPSEAYPGWWAIIPVLGTVFIIWSGQSSTLTSIHRLLATSPMIGIGLVSYSWYLWHWPALAMTEAINLRPLPLASRILLVLATLGIACASYLLVERRFHRRGVSPRSGVALASPTRVLAVGAICIAVTVLVAGAVGLRGQLMRQEPQWRAVGEQLVDRVVLPSDCAGGRSLPISASACPVTAFRPERPTVVLWGDSHARQFIPSMEAAANGKGVNVVAWIGSGCPPFDPSSADEQSVLPAASQTLFRDCQAGNEAALQFVGDLLRNSGDVRVVLAARWVEYLDPSPAEFVIRPASTQAYVDAVSRSLRSGGPGVFRELALLGAQVDIVAPVPELSRNGPLCEARNLWFSCNVDRISVADRTAQAVAWLREVRKPLPSGSRWINIADSVCDSAMCYASSDGLMNYSDDNHLSVSRAATLSSYFQPSIDSLLRSVEDPGAGSSQ